MNQSSQRYRQLHDRPGQGCDLLHSKLQFPLLPIAHAACQQRHRHPQRPRDEAMKMEHRKMLGNDRFFDSSWTSGLSKIGCAIDVRIAVVMRFLLYHVIRDLFHTNRALFECIHQLHENLLVYYDSFPYHTPNPIIWGLHRPIPSVILATICAAFTS